MIWKKCSDSLEFCSINPLTNWIIPHTDRITPSTDNFGPQIFILMLLFARIDYFIHQNAAKVINHKIRCTALSLYSYIFSRQMLASIMWQIFSVLLLLVLFSMAPSATYRWKSHSPQWSWLRILLIAKLNWFRRKFSFINLFQFNFTTNEQVFVWKLWESHEMYKMQRTIL